MNSYELKCYQKTYQAKHYWDGIEFESEAERKYSWSDCRGLSDRFYNELIKRGYLIPKSPNQN